MSMNYRHAFHAGNHADVFKHLVLTNLINLMSHKATAFAYVDTHAGVGLYDLYGNEAQRTGEWLTGIKLLLDQPNHPAFVASYVEVIHALNPQQQLRYYPGSPLLAQRLMRSQDKLILNELHPQDLQLLKQLFKEDHRISIHNQNGWLLAKALFPLAEKRALILIDSPFEKTDDFAQCLNALTEITKRMRQAVVAVWYPIKKKEDLKGFYLNVTRIKSIPKLLKVEMLMQAADNNLGLNGSGMVIANPPWKLEVELVNLLNYLKQILAPNTGKYSIDWLIAEKS